MKMFWKITIKTTLFRFGIVLALLSLALCAVPSAEPRASALSHKNAAPIPRSFFHPNPASTATWHVLPNQGLDNYVQALAVSGSDLYVGGAFDQTGDGVLANLGSIVRYDTTTATWHALPNQGLDGTVRALMVLGNDLYVGGTFGQTGDGTLTGLGNIVRYDTTAGVWHPLPNQGLHSHVYTLATSGSDLYVGGSFNQTNDWAVTDLGCIARYDTTTGTWHALPNQGLDGTIRALVMSGNNLYLGGLFAQTGDGTLMDLGGIARYDTTTGTWHALPNQGLDNRTLALAAVGNGLYVGGNFAQTGDGTLTNLGGIAHYNTTTSTWHALPNQGLDGTLWALAVSNDELYAGGYFTKTGDGTLTGLSNIAHYDTTAGTWHALPNQGLDKTVQALAVVGDELYAGGLFTQTNDGTLTDLGHIARYDITLLYVYLPLVFNNH